MTRREMAQQLGRRGGRRRAARLSAEDKRRIASLGGQARAASFAIARRVDETLRYAAVLRELQPTLVTRQKTHSERLPGIYPDEP